MLYYSVSLNGAVPSAYVFFQKEAWMVQKNHVAYILEHTHAKKPPVAAQTSHIDRTLAVYG